MAVDYKIKKEANELQKEYDLTSYEALSLALQARQIEVIEKFKTLNLKYNLELIADQMHSNTGKSKNEI